jgi:hypothetical protein
MKRRLSILLPFLLLLSAAYQVHRVAASAALAESIQPAQLRSDLAFLRDAVARRHPRFHDNPMDPELLQRFAEVEAGIQAPMSQAEAYRHFARLNPAFRDAHTLLMPILGDAPDPDRGLFPFRVRLDPRGTLHVRDSWVRAGDGMRLDAGVRIVSINAVATADLLDELAAYGHGETRELQRYMLTVMFPKWLSAVRGWRNEFEVEVEIEAGQRRVRMARDDVWSPLASQAPSFLPILDLQDDGIAWLRLPTFNVEKAVGPFREAVDAAFGRIRSSRTRALIIDVRGNTGGQSGAGAYVIRYLIDRPISQVSRARERVNEDNRGLFGYRGRVGELREMDVSRDEKIEPVPAAMRFDGTVVLLIDAMTYSAGILFATALQDHSIAIVIGQPTGGNANQTGNMEPVYLPHSRLLAHIPARVFVRPSGDQSVAPVIPDIVVDPALPGPDPVLATAVSYLMKARRGAGS